MSTRTPDPTRAQRQADHRKRLREQGLTTVTSIVPARDKDRLAKYAKGLRDRFEKEKKGEAGKAESKES